MAVRNKTGKLVYLRVHQTGGGYGPPSDFIDGEVVIKFKNDGPRAYGFKLRTDVALPAHEAMFALLKDAYVNDLDVSVDYDELPGRNNSNLFRVWLAHP